MKRSIIISLLLVLYGSMSLMAQNFQLSKVSANIQAEKEIVALSDRETIEPEYVRGKNIDDILIFFLGAIAGLILVILIEKIQGMYEFWHFGIVNWYFVAITIIFPILCVTEQYLWLGCLCIIASITLWIIWNRFSKRCKKCKKWGSMEVFKKELIEQRASTVKDSDGVYLPATTYIFHIHRRCKACGYEDYLRSKKKEKN